MSLLCLWRLGGRGDVEKRWRRMEKRHRPDRTHRLAGDSVRLLEVVRVNRQAARPAIVR